MREPFARIVRLYSVSALFSRGRLAGVPEKMDDAARILSRRRSVTALVLNLGFRLLAGRALLWSSIVFRRASLVYVLPDPRLSLAPAAGAAPGIEPGVLCLRADQHIHPLSRCVRLGGIRVERLAAGSQCRQGMELARPSVSSRFVIGCAGSP